MTRVLDNNTLIYLQRNALTVRPEHHCCVPEEIEEEFRGNAASERWLRKNPLVVKHLDEVAYLTAYAHFLNSYNGVSFYSLKGFGDVAILATLSLLVAELPATQPLSQGLFPEHSIFLVTDDVPLTRAVRAAFPRVIIESSSSFASTL